MQMDGVIKDKEISKMAAEFIELTDAIHNTKILVSRSKVASIQYGTALSSEEGATVYMCYGNARYVEESYDYIKLWLLGCMKEEKPYAGIQLMDATGEK